jgi:hypothetical protein
MSANGLYNPDQSAVDTRWTDPWSEAFRVSVSCLCYVECSVSGVLSVWSHRVNALSLWRYTTLEKASLTGGRHNEILDFVYRSISILCRPYRWHKRASPRTSMNIMLSKNASQTC